MTFLYPMMLWALALPLLLAVLALVKRHRSGKAWRKLVSPAHEATLVARTPAWRSTLPFILTLAALTAGILATARPIHGYTTTEAQASGRNLLIALDISRSMETQDVKPSRLEEARAAAFELVDALPGDKIGLIVFSGEADLVVPLTYDHTALRDALEQVNRSWAGFGGTNFGLVLKKAMQDFTRSAPTGTNALVIFSDGEDTVGTTLDVAREAREQHLLVITVGVGTSIGESIPDARGENGLYQDADGKHVISKLDVESLRRFAEATGGDFFTMGSGADLTAFARQAVEKLDRHEESFSGHKVPRDLFPPFAITALVLLATAILLATEWKPARPGASLLLILTGLAASPAEAAPKAESLSAYEEGLTLLENDADKARECFSRALLDDDTEMQAACHYALGNMDARSSFERLRRLCTPEQTDEEGAAPMSAPRQPRPEQLQEIVDALEQGLQPYRDALKLRPDMKAAQSNMQRIEQFIEKLKEEIERLKQQQEQQQQPDANKEQNDSQDQSGQSEQQDQNEQGNPDDDDQQDGEQDQQKDQQQDQPRDEEDQQGQNDQQQNSGEEPQPDQQPSDDEQDNGQPKDAGQEEERQQPPPAQEAPLSDKEKSEQRASSILRMHVDEEQGSPIPRTDWASRPPEKDY